MGAFSWLTNISGQFWLYSVVVGLAWTTANGIARGAQLDVLSLATYVEKWPFALAYYVFQITGMFFFQAAIHQEGLTLAIIIPPLIATLTTLALAYGYFGDRLNSPQYVGVALALVAMVLISLPGDTFRKLGL